MLLGALNYLMGYRRVRCEKRDVLRLLNVMKTEEIEYWGLKREEDGASFFLLDREFRRLGKLLGENCPDTVRRYGLPYLLFRYRKRVGILLGLLLTLVLTKLSTLYVWEVTVSGNEALSDAEVIAALEELGCGVGSYIPGVDFYELCHAFLLANDSVAWVSVNMVGTTAEIKLIERAGKDGLEEDHGTPSNLVARFDGEIVRTEVTGGELTVLPGQTVSKGEMLVSGVLGIGQGEDPSRFLLTRAKGRVYAKVERTFEVVVPLTSVKRTVGERVVVKKTLKFFGKSLKLQENSSILPQDCDIITERKRIVLFEDSDLIGGVPLPVTLITEFYEEVTEEEVTRTEAEALAVAEEEMAGLVASELADAELISRESSYELRLTDEGDALLLRWKIVCIQDIAEEVPLGTQ